MSVPRLYRDLAHLWPLLSPPDHYVAEADIIRELLEHHDSGDDSGDDSGGGGCRSLVEFGVGGGHTIHHLLDDFDCFAVDASPDMLAQCRKLNPALTTTVGDMRTVRLGRMFDAVLIHDAIDYMTTVGDVRAALATAAAHLRPGGLALIAPTYTTKTFTDHEAEYDEHAGFAYDSIVRRTSDTTFDLELTYHVAGESIRDLHHCGLFPRQFWLEAMHDAGLSAEHHADELWELFIGVRAG